MKIVAITDAQETGLGAQTAWLVSDELAEAIAAMLGEPDANGLTDLDALDTSAVVMVARGTEGTQR